MPKLLAYWVSSELVYPYTRVHLRARAIVCVQAAVVVLTLCKMTVSQTQITPPVSDQTLTLLESLQSTMANQPQLHIQQQQVEISRALKQQATGDFDFALAGSFSQARTNLPLTVAERALVLAEGFAPTANLAQNISNLNLSATKMFRNGVGISTIYATTRTTDNLTTAEGTNVSHLGFHVTLPLLRGRGRAAVAGRETAADLEVSASLLDLDQTVNDLLADTAAHYWNAVAAVRQLGVARGSEERGRIYVDNIRTLIQADRLPKADINQAAANLDARTASRIAAEQNLVQSQQQLAQAMGMDAVRMANTNFTFENFPDSASRRLPAVNAETISKYLQQAFSKREDYRAAQRRVEESRALLPVARSGLKPRLDLNFDAGVSGLSEGAAPAQFVNSPYRSIQGLDAIAGIIFAFPVRNNFAVGQVRQAEATLAQAQLKVEDLRRGISSSVITALNAVCNTAAQVDRAREAVVSFQAALQGEREKFSLGFSSVVDVLTVEDRLTTAMTSQVNAELSYAIALTQLRSATGTIVESGKAGYSVTQDVFFSVP